MLKIFLTFSIVGCALILFSQNSETTVFKAGEGGYKSYRIPAIINLPDGDLLAFCEGRANNTGDFGDVDIVMKRSSDKGKSWSALQVVADNENLQAGNPAPVVDLTDPDLPYGIIFVFYNTGNSSEAEVRKGKGLREVWYKMSLDNGFTWSPGVNITLQVHRPKQPLTNPDYNFKEDWRSYANTPGHAMQFVNGKFRGRIFVAANHSTGAPKEKFEDYFAHGYYTDDRGKTFHLSENIKLPGSNESMATELLNNRLMMNIRNQRGDTRERIVAISKNGGMTWDSVFFDHHLPDPGCQGSILTVVSKKRKDIIAFCNLADTKRRDNLTLRISEDEGKTWKKSYVIYNSKTESNNDPAGYSDLVVLHKNVIGILYEKDNYNKIIFTTLTLK
ncbi:MAG: exo-alpha-sialidase [Bacteroidetes bacterium]|nr:exo-alpha-sialidase [Bacteroidota bacterium]